VDGHFRQLLFAQEEREGISTGVLFTDFLDFHIIIRQEVINRKQIHATLERIILPQSIKRQHLPIIIQILGESPIGMPTSQLHLNILLILLRIRRINPQILLLNIMLERILGLGLRIIELLTHILVKLPGELITVIDMEYPLIEVDVLPHLKILPDKMLIEIPNPLRYFLSLDEQPLGYARILHSGLDNQYGLIGQVVINHDLPDPVILQRTLNDMLLEKGIEPEHLPVVFDPGGLDARDVVVFGEAALAVDQGEVEFALGHLVDQVLVVLLLQRRVFELLGVVDHAQQLRLVVVLFVWVGVDVPGQERHLFGQVDLHEVVFL
jgi:hypothetical protein